MPILRLFVAIPGGEELVKALTQARDRLRRDGAPLRFENPERVHLTVKFLGDTPEERRDAVAQACREALREIPAFDLLFRGAGAFPSPQRPRVVWMGACDSAGLLNRAAKALEDRLHALGFPREERPFRGHVTIGRARGISQKVHPAVSSFLQEEADAVFGGQRVAELALYESRLHPGGPEHLVLEKFPLASP